MKEHDAQGQNHAATSQGTWPVAAQLFLAIAIIAAVALAAHAFGIVLCPLKRFTGVPCPSCGATRAALSVLHGDIAGAFRIQPLIMTLATAAVPVALATRLSRRARRFLKAAARHPLAWILATAAVLANWAYVILNGN